MFGRIVAISGLILFLAACVQLTYVQLLRKDEEIVTYGLYSVVRHPQYFGIIGVTLGITIMCIQSDFGGQVTEIWPIQVLGYILLAGYEERHLMKEHEEEYQSYKEKVAFIFPIPAIPLVPEPLVSLAVAYFVLFLLNVV
ncbi:MAG: isoprenylcysteine carboxylmethyltransferase family protein, partial [Candidatus Bathyarchaeia archaeon]